MGNIDHIDQLETYISELGNEIDRVKKASEYLKLIEQFQRDIDQTSNTIKQSKDQLTLYQEIMESKLDLFQTIVRNIDSKQQSIEETQNKIITNLSEMEQQQIKDIKGLNSSINEVNNQVNLNQNILMEKIKLNQEAQNTLLKTITKSQKIYFSINLALALVTFGLLFYLLSK